MSTEATSSKIWFQKFILSMPYIVQGRPVQWDPLDKDEGVRGFDPANPEDAKIIPELLDAAGKRGGIERISEEQAENLKKNQPFNPSGNKSSKDVLRLHGRAWRPPVTPPPNAAPAAVSPSADPNIPTTAAGFQGAQAAVPSATKGGLPVPLDPAAVAALEQAAAALKIDEPPAVPTGKLSELKGKKGKASKKASAPMPEPAPADGVAA